MGTIITVKSSSYQFYFDGKKIYVKMPGILQQQFLIEKNYNEKRMPDDDYVMLVHFIYRGKIKDTDTFNNHIYSKFKLTTSLRKF